MTTTRRALSGLLAAAIAISVMALTGPGANAGATGPRLALRRTSSEITVTRQIGDRHPGESREPLVGRGLEH